MPIRYGEREVVSIEGDVSNKNKDTILWALVIAAYNLEKLDDGVPRDLENIRKLLSMYAPATVSLYFLRAALAFNPPESLEQAQALYEHYGVDASGLERKYPERKPQ